LSDTYADTVVEDIGRLMGGIGRLGHDVDNGANHFTACFNNFG